jgi:hypothetical protein
MGVSIDFQMDDNLYLLYPMTLLYWCFLAVCRSCIVKHLEAHKTCPRCDVLVHKTKPLLNLRYVSSEYRPTLQSICCITRPCTCNIPWRYIKRFFGFIAVECLLMCSLIKGVSVMCAKIHLSIMCILCEILRYIKHLLWTRMLNGIRIYYNACALINLFTWKWWLDYIFETISFHRPDRTLQTLVYKLVPGVFQSK